MEEKKFDPYQFIGFILIALILTWMLYRNGPQETVQTQNDKQTINAPLNQAIQDSIQSQQKIKAYGDLGNFFIPNDQSNIQFTTNSMNVEIQSKGAEINALLLSEFENYELTDEKPKAVIMGDIYKDFNWDILDKIFKLISMHFYV